TSAVNHPASTAMKPLGKDRNATHRNQRVLSSRPRQRRKLPNQDTASIIRPIPTMTRNAKKGMITGGRSSGGKVSNPISRAVQLPDALQLPSGGISIANSLSSANGSG